jgi:hypothetical protein
VPLWRKLAIFNMRGQIKKSSLYNMDLSYWETWQSIVTACLPLHISLVSSFKLTFTQQRSYWMSQFKYHWVLDVLHFLTKDFLFTVYMYGWGTVSSGILHCMTVYLVPDILKLLRCLETLENQISSDAVSYFRKTGTSTTPLWKLRNLNVEFS